MSQKPDGRELLVFNTSMFHRRTALPTRDAVLPIVVALRAARERGGSLSELVADLPARYTASGLLRPVPSPKPSSSMPRSRAEDNYAYPVLVQRPNQWLAAML